MSGWSRRATKRIEAETDLAKGKPRKMCDDPTCPDKDGLLCNYVDDPVTKTKAMKKP